MYTSSYVPGFERHSRDPFRNMYYSILVWKIVGPLNFHPWYLTISLRKPHDECVRRSQTKACWWISNTSHFEMKLERNLENKSLLDLFLLCSLSINFEFLFFIPSSLLAVMVMMHSTILAPCLRRRIKTKRRFTTLSSTAGYDPTAPYPLTDNRFAVNGGHSRQPQSENTASRRSTTRKRTTWSRCEFSSTNSRSPWPIIWLHKRSKRFFASLTDFIVSTAVSTQTWTWQCKNNRDYGCTKCFWSTRRICLFTANTAVICPGHKLWLKR